MSQQMNFILTILVFRAILVEGGILYPQVTPTRQLFSLDGLWRFSLSTNGSFDHEENLTDEDSKDLHLMPVPSSYNDILTSLEGRDHLGPVKYERSFYVPKGWLDNDTLIWLRFGSVCYAADVYINGQHAMTHFIGHLPFEGDITTLLIDGLNLITVFVDNTLTPTSIPQGSKETLPSGRVKQTYTYDFFNYAGIDRPVYIYTKPKMYLDDITIKTTLNGQNATVNFSLKTIDKDSNFRNSLGLKYKITVKDKNNNEVVSKTKLLDKFMNDENGSVEIPNATLWWPYLMNEQPGLMYTLTVELFDDDSTTLIDSYIQKFGVRELFWDNNTFTVNGKPIYFRGMGRHEDSDIRGKGLDLPLLIRDHNLMRWLGANSYRTSHYPYAEEIMDMADQFGIMIIDEAPSVNTHNYDDELLENHKRSLSELYQRDKNRPSVVMWSVSNEANTKDTASGSYYNLIVAHIKSFDSTRPVSMAMYYDADEDNAGEYMDIICFNKYEAWYIYAGDVDVIVPEVLKVAEGWRKKHNKLVMLTEYGADSQEGLHILPSYMWSEEFHLDLMSNYFEAFDQLREKGWFIGEMIWNFADFKTASDIRRVGGNKKGVFTRQRQPKNAAHLLRRRYWSLANALDNATLPKDLNRYVLNKPLLYKDEL